eukprot:TRINITY_DN1179_c0_g1_i1.p5 TRINITY_DN1179_c0_g1~~TRINITY_DN1179_c0_g1_i1.p5  ORF type:complete len:105 (-),score=21.84 TRINITY_DN1179_c0_g1_i1:594-908(-)
MYDSDGDLLIVPEKGALHIQTELGHLEVPPGHIAVIPRGIHFSVSADPSVSDIDGQIMGGHFTLPDLGPIGSNGLANPRDFEYPVAAYSEGPFDWQIVNKFQGR